MHAVTDAASLHLLQEHIGSLPSNVFWHQSALLALHKFLRLSRQASHSTDCADS